MEPNPVLKELGFDKDDRVVIVHTDDIGMCQAANAAFSELWDFGLISSGAVMVPCPWFPQTARFCRQHPEVDMGVHLTLNCEWDTFRWGPVASVDTNSGLIDADGYFHKDPDITEETANLACLRREIESQLSKALIAGIDVTHIDTHMFALASHRFFGDYIRLGLAHNILPVVIRPGTRAWAEWGFNGEHAETYKQAVAPMLDYGLPMVDAVIDMSLETHEDRFEEAKQKFDQLPAGITHFLLHPTIDSPEVQAMAPDWLCRVEDYKTFLLPELKKHLDHTGVHVVGYRELRDIMRKRMI